MYAHLLFKDRGDNAKPAAQDTHGWQFCQALVLTLALSWKPAEKDPRLTPILSSAGMPDKHDLSYFAVYTPEWDIQTRANIWLPLITQCLSPHTPYTHPCIDQIHLHSQNLNTSLLYLSTKPTTILNNDNIWYFILSDKQAHISEQSWTKDRNWFFFSVFSVQVSHYSSVLWLFLMRVHQWKMTNCSQAYYFLQINP